MGNEPPRVGSPRVNEYFYCNRHLHNYSIWCKYCQQERDGETVKYVRDRAAEDRDKWEQGIADVERRERERQRDAEEESRRRDEARRNEEYQWAAQQRSEEQQRQNDIMNKYY